jgi:hypothetical protein
MIRRPLTFRRVAARAGLRFLLYAAVAVPVLTSLPTYLDEVGGPPWWTTDPAVAVLADIHDCAARIGVEFPAGALIVHDGSRVEYATLDEGLAAQGGHPAVARTIAWCES